MSNGGNSKPGIGEQVGMFLCPLALPGYKDEMLPIILLLRNTPSLNNFACLRLFS